MVQLDLNKSARHSCSIPGKVVASVSIDKNTYCHGEDIPITVKVDNGTSKMVKSVRVRKLFCNFPGFRGWESGGAPCVYNFRQSGCWGQFGQGGLLSWRGYTSAY